MPVFYYHTLSLFGADEDLETAVLFFRDSKIAYQEKDAGKLPLIGNLLFDMIMDNIELHPVGYYPKITYRTKLLPNTTDIYLMSEILNLVVVHDYHADKHDIWHKFIFTPGRYEQFVELDETDRNSIGFHVSTGRFVCQNEFFDTARLAIDFILYQKIRKEVLEGP